ncbi:hypothetical protein EDD16DRAFT_1716019 [Pisolithus croceorrhizus]|nr:hypothetical protein EDD16DRAFT_1716019 [Pisolithus croceorrhizus]
MIPPAKISFPQVHTKPFLTQGEKEELVDVLRICNLLANRVYEGYLVVDLVLHTNYKSMEFRLLLYRLVYEVPCESHLQTPIEGAPRERLEELDKPWSQEQASNPTELWPVSPVEHAFEQNPPAAQNVAQRRQSLASAPPPLATRTRPRPLSASQSSSSPEPPSESAKRRVVSLKRSSSISGARVGGDPRNLNTAGKLPTLAEE